MIYDALRNIQQSLKAPKGQRNTFGNYNYRSCEDILEAVKPLLAKNGVVLTLSDEMVEVGGRIYVMAVACLADGKESIRTTAYAREEETKKGMDSSQITGAASSYARKYALNGLFCIDDTKDSDATNTHDEEPPKKAEKSSEPVCERCGKKIVPYTDGNGKTVSVSRLCSSSVSKFGKILCVDCVHEGQDS